MELFSKDIPIRIVKNGKVTPLHLPIKDIVPDLSLLNGESLPAVKDYVFDREPQGNIKVIDREDPVIFVNRTIINNATEDQSDLLVKSLNFYPDDKQIVNPQVESGKYNISNYKFFLGNESLGREMFSDVSMEIEDIKDDFLSVVIWKRDVSSYPEIEYQEIELSEPLYGSLEETGRDDEDSGNGPYQYQFDWESNTITLNRLAVKGTFGSVDTPKEIVHNCEDMGIGDGLNGFYYFTKYFPINKDSVRIFEIDIDKLSSENSDDITEWTLVDSLLESEDAKEFIVDESLGCIKTGGILGGSSSLSFDLLDSDTTLSLEDTSNFPYKGKILITDGVDSETLFYLGKDEFSLFNLNRSAAANWNQGSIVQVLQTGAITNTEKKYFVYYSAYPEAIFNKEKKKAERKHFLTSLNNIKDSKAILALHRKLLIPHSINLRVLNLKRFMREGEGFWGPLYSGEIAIIEGIVTDRIGNPIPNIEVTLQSNDYGHFEYVGNEIIVTSNDDGKFWVTYVPDPGIGLEPVYARAKDVFYSGDYTTINFNYPEDIRIESDDLNLISLYSVLKNDGTVGTIGYKHEIRYQYLGDSGDMSSMIGSSMSLVAPGFYDGDRIDVSDGILVVNDSYFDDVESFENAKVYYKVTPLPYTGSVQPFEEKVATIKEVIRFIPDGTSMLNSSDKMHTYVLLTEEVLDSGFLPHTISEIRVIKASEVEYDSVRLNGRKGVIKVRVNEDSEGDGIDPEYTVWDGEDTARDISLDDWVHPHSNGDFTVYKPVTPVEEVGPNIFNFRGTLPLPDETDNDNLLAAYAIYGGRRGEVVAHCNSFNRYGSLIYSNTLLFLNSISPKDRGTLLSDSGYVPFGFRLRSDTFEGASTITTPTYLTINYVPHIASTGSLKMNLISAIDSGAMIYGEDAIGSSLHSLSFEINLKE